MEEFKRTDFERIQSLNFRYSITRARLICEPISYVDAVIYSYFIPYLETFKTVVTR
jgi:hypothetical protein